DHAGREGVEAGNARAGSRCTNVFGQARVHSCKDREAGMGKGLSDSEWQEAATAASITAAHKVVLRDDAGINKNAPVGRLSDLEWGWIVAAVIFAWISTCAQQATEEGRDVEQVIRTSMLDPNPWDAGMVTSILPKLVEILPDVDWSKPIGGLVP